MNQYVLCTLIVFTVVVMCHLRSCSSYICKLVYNLLTSVTLEWLLDWTRSLCHEDCNYTSIIFAVCGSVHWMIHLYMIHKKTKRKWYWLHPMSFSVLSVTTALVYKDKYLSTNFSQSFIIILAVLSGIGDVIESCCCEKQGEERSCLCQLLSCLRILYRLIACVCKMCQMCVCAYRWCKAIRDCFSCKDFQSLEDRERQRYHHSYP